MADSETTNRQPVGTSSQLIIVGCLLISDLAAVAASFALSFLIRRSAPLLDPLAHGQDIYLSAWPVVFLWLLSLWREGLYPGFWLTTGEELERSVKGTTLASVLIMAATFVTRTGPQFSRPILVGGWLISMVLIPGFRFFLKTVLKALGFSGPRAIVMGGGATARIILEGLSRQRLPALKPVAVFDDDPKKRGNSIQGVEIFGPVSSAVSWAKAHGLSTAIVAMPSVSRERLIPIISLLSSYFKQIIVIPNLLGLSATDSKTHQLQGILALELRNNLLSLPNRVIKRIIDLAILLLGLILVVPLTLAISISILVESGRPALFRQDRIGRNGVSFGAWKFRTMMVDSDRVLEAALNTKPVLMDEWAATQKLKQDPRLTEVGRIIRRLSLDELPQLWNVVRGEMSLVGPRPIVKDEISKYGDAIDLYMQVLPGLTGLWQVSGRSDLPYEDRVWLDSHYVRNWSIWLDLVILVRTVWAVLTGRGAY